MNKNEALKLALEALDGGHLDRAYGYIQEALAQPDYRAVKTYHEGKPVYVSQPEQSGFFSRDAMMAHSDCPDYTTPPAQPEQEPVAGCACRWDAEGDRVATCERHQGWLEVIVEWADRAREAEKKLKALAQRENGTESAYQRGHLDGMAKRPQPEQEPVAFLAESTRFKVTLTERDCKITGLPRELGGRWVALIGAENDCHLRLTTPPLLVQPPKREWVDLTDEDVEIINGNTWDVREAARMASAKSKEKNT